MNKAFSHIILPDGTCHSQAVVEFDTEGRPISWHPLTSEEPFTEWHNETYTLTFNP